MNKKRINSILLISMLVMSTLIGVFNILPNNTTQAATLTSYQYVREIKINSSDYTNDLNGFPVWLNISDTQMNGDVLTNAYDIAIYQQGNSTQVPHEIEWYDNGGHYSIFFNVSHMDASADVYYYLYYGNPSETTNQSNHLGVWDENYVGVWHHNQSDLLFDSGIYGNHGQPNGTIVVTNGDVGEAIIYDGTSTAWNLSTAGCSGPGSFQMGTAGVTITSRIVNSVMGADTQTIFGKNRFTGEGEYDLQISRPADDEWAAYRQFTAPAAATLAVMELKDTAGNYSDSNWHTLASTSDTANPTKGYCAIDMRTFGANTQATDVGSTNTDNFWVTVGGIISGGTSPGTIRNKFNGTMSELRLSNITRNDTWMNATHDNLNSTEYIDFIFLGDEGANPTYDPPTIPTHYIDCSGQENSSWLFSEHVQAGNLMENWWFDNYTHWGTHDRTAEGWIGNFSLAFDNASGAYIGNTSIALINSSGMNRSQTLVNIHTNASQTNDWAAGVIYRGNASTNFSAVLYGNYGGSQAIFLLDWNGTQWNDTVYGNKVENMSQAYNWYTVASENPGWTYGQDGEEPVYWESNSNATNGTWIKTIYNTYCGSINSKIWGAPTFNGLLNEPTGWAINLSLPDNISTDNCMGHGLVVWNPWELSNRWDFDCYEVWQLNYSVNHSDYINLTENISARPRMDFPIIDMMNSEVNETFYDFFYEYFEGNISVYNYSKFIRALTNFYGMESRWKNNSKDTRIGDQNDTVYYYSAIITNYSAWHEEWFGEPAAWNNFLTVWIDQCTDGTNSSLDDYAILNIDVDNDREWNSNDRMFYWSADGIRWAWNSTDSLNFSARAAASAWISDKSGIRNIHRYNAHRMYAINVKLDDLVKADGNYLNVTDTFGLNVITCNADDGATIWQNWNESTCRVYYDETDCPTAKQPFLNTSTFEESLPPPVNNTCIERWGEGEILAGFINQSYSLGLNIHKYANISYYNNATQNYTWINYTINVSNTGTGTLTGIRINETWFNCTCSNWNWTLAWTSPNYNWTIDGDQNVSWHNDSCYVLLNITNLTGDSYFNFSFHVFVWECSDVVGTMRNYANVTCDQGFNATSYWDIQWGGSTYLSVIISKSTYDSVGTGNSIFGIIGVIMIIGAIMTIIFMIRKAQEGGGW